MFEATPKVSVIMPVYNVEPYIEDSLNSIIRQSLREIEIICINDGSLDRTPEILHTFAQQDRRIVIIDQMNQGQSKARNLGLSLAKGEYIYFFDSDDLLAEDALNILYHHANRTGTQLILFDGSTFFDNEALELKFNQKKTMYHRNHEYMGVYKGDELFAAMINNGDYVVSPCLQFFEHKYLRDHNIQFREGIIHEDNLFSLQALLLCERACHLSNSLFQRRVRENSTMTSEFNSEHYIGHYTGLIEMFNFIMMSREKIENHAIIAAKDRLTAQYKTTIYEYEMLPSEQQCQPIFSDPVLVFLSDVLYTPLIVYIKTVSKYKKEIFKERKEILKARNEIDSLKRKLIEKQEKLREKQEKLREEREKKVKLYDKNEQLNRLLIEAREEIEAIKRSKTYLTGKAIMFIPKAIRRLFHK